MKLLLNLCNDEDLWALSRGSFPDACWECWKAVTHCTQGKKENREDIGRHEQKHPKNNISPNHSKYNVHIIKLHQYHQFSSNYFVHHTSLEPLQSKVRRCPVRSNPVDLAHGNEPLSWSSVRRSHDQRPPLQQGIHFNLICASFISSWENIHHNTSLYEWYISSRYILYHLTHP